MALFPSISPVVAGLKYIWFVIRMDGYDLIARMTLQIVIVPLTGIGLENVTEKPHSVKRLTNDWQTVLLSSG